MSRLLKSLEPLSQCAPCCACAPALRRGGRLSAPTRRPRRYKDRKFDGSLEEYVACLRGSSTVYVGNLAFHTTEEQIHELFSKCGPLQRIVMGLDKNSMTVRAVHARCRPPRLGGAHVTQHGCCRWCRGRALCTCALCGWWRR
jgi:hypothetical protein